MRIYPNFPDTLVKSFAPDIVLSFQGKCALAFLLLLAQFAIQFRLFVHLFATSIGIKVADKLK